MLPRDFNELRRYSLHLHPNQFVGIGLQSDGPHFLSVIRCYALYLHPDQLLRTWLQPQVMEFADIFRCDSLHFHPNGILDTEVGVVSPQLVNVFRRDALNLQGNEFVHVRDLDTRRRNRVHIRLLLIVARTLRLVGGIRLRLWRSRWSRRGLCGLRRSLLRQSRFGSYDDHTAVFLSVLRSCACSQRGVRDTQESVAG